MQLTVADIQKIDVKDGQTLVVFIDITGHSRKMAEDMLRNAAHFMRQAIPNPNVQIIAVPQHLYSFGIINPTGSGQPIPVIKTLNGAPIGANTPVANDDAFDRAMKGLI